MDEVGLITSLTETEKNLVRQEIKKNRWSRVIIRRDGVSVAVTTTPNSTIVKARRQDDPDDFVLDLAPTVKGSRMFRTGDVVRLKDSPYQGTVTSTNAACVWFTDEKTQSSISVSPGLLERVLPDVHAGDIWKDKENREWVVLKHAGVPGTVRVQCTDEPYFITYSNHPEGSERSLADWFAINKPVRIRMRAPGTS